MGTNINVPFNQVPILCSYYILGAVIAMLMAIIVHFAEKEAPEILEEKSISQHVYEDPGVFIDGIFFMVQRYF